jgi:hypothetical protein
LRSPTTVIVNNMARNPSANSQPARNSAPQPLKAQAVAESREEVKARPVNEGQQSVKRVKYAKKSEKEENKNGKKDGRSEAP